MDWQSLLPCRGWAETNRSRSCSFPKLFLIVLIMSDTIITAAAMRVIKLLVGHPPRKVLDLIDETGLTRTAVTEQLKNLAAGGFIVRRSRASLWPGPPSSSLHGDTGRPGPAVCQQPAVGRADDLGGRQRGWRRGPGADGSACGQPTPGGTLSGENHGIRSADANQTVQGDSESRRRPHRPGEQAGPDYAIEADLRSSSACSTTNGTFAPSTST